MTLFLFRAIVLVNALVTVSLLFVVFDNKNRIDKQARDIVNLTGTVHCYKRGGNVSIASVTRSKDYETYRYICWKSATESLFDWYS